MKPSAVCSAPDLNRILQDLQSPDESLRAKAVRSLCPCHAGWPLFEQHIPLVEALKKDPSSTVRANARHVFEDAAEMQSSGYPTHPREATNDMLRKKRQSRFRPDPEELEQAQRDRRKVKKWASH
ncbi:MAG TPA: hypothetical protein VFA07_01390 [Chthonomonadaceae bacterium]|nr:hypothetical protein [Chthonomonadaceae bacterium]